MTFADQFLGRFAIWAAVYNGAQGVISAVLLIFLTRDLDLGAGVVGLVLSLGYGAAFVGALVVSPVSERIGFGRCLVLTASVAAPPTCCCRSPRGRTPRRSPSCCQRAAGAHCAGGYGPSDGQFSFS